MEIVDQRIQVPQSLDVEAVERALAELWQQTAGDEEAEDGGTLRARVADLMVFVTSDATLTETRASVRDLALVHPCRALVMLADRDGESSDIEMSVSTFCQRERLSKKVQLSCEEVTLVARGGFTSELPSAVIPLLVPDLPIFLWWRDLERLEDQCFQPLAHAADRLVIDSVDLKELGFGLEALSQLLDRQGREAIAVSDINWARLTSWRALLANFYDVAEYRSLLSNLEEVRIEYVAPEGNASSLAPQGLLIAGWLASRLRWDVEPNSAEHGEGLAFNCRQNGKKLRLLLKRVEGAEIKPGRLSKIELFAGGSDGASFVVTRTDDGLHLETQATIGGLSCPGRTLPVRNRSTAELLACEMEILAKDIPYEDAVRQAARMIDLVDKR
ncbi:MAG: glucose-6-phosphate dehydrogenase assembly protein OpcA [Pyrinomonadaceae bacterium]